MAEIYQPKLHPGALQDHLRAALRQPGDDQAGLTSQPAGLPELRLQPPFTPKPPGTGYHAADLLQFHDETFLRHAYRVLLGRTPDAGGAGGYLSALRSGRVNRLDVLARLRFSPEGVRRDVPLASVRVPAALRRAYRIPVAGPVLRWCVSLLRLPNLVRHVSQLEAHAIAQQEQIARYANELNRHYHQQTLDAATQCEQLSRQFRELEQWHESASATYAEMAQLSLLQLAGEFNSKLAIVAEAQQQNAAHCRDLSEQQRQAENTQQTQSAMLSAQLKQQKTQLAAQTERLAAQESQLAEQQTQFATQESQLGEHKTQLAAQAERLERQASQLIAQAQRLAAQEAALAAGQTALAARQKENAAWRAAQEENLAGLAAEFATQIADATRQVVAWRTELVRQLGNFAERSETETQTLSDRLAVAETQQHNLTQQVTDADSQRREDLAQVENLVHAANKQAARQEQTTQEALAQHDERLTRLLTLVRERNSPSLTAPEHLTLNEAEQRRLDNFYVALEDRLRGSRETILQRLQVYLPLLRENGLGTTERPVLDVGCGRGEWLELLRDEGFTASGVDTNRVLTEQCRALSLQVTEADALDYLRSLPDGSCGAVTCFHLVEHLPLEMVLALLNETRRVLQPGGLALFETPNPRNVLVGSCNFYYDPTHRNPLPSPVLQFMLESAGLERAQIWNLNPSDAQPVAGEEDIVQRFNEYFYGPMDYAALGWQPF